MSTTIIAIDLGKFKSVNDLWATMFRHLDTRIDLRSGVLTQQTTPRLIV
jgi:hypothetical protein